MNRSRTRAAAKRLAVVSAFALLGGARDASAHTHAVPAPAWAGSGSAGGTFFGKKPDPSRTRDYFVAAEPVLWDYAPLGRDPVSESPLPAEWRDLQAYKKYRYVAYTDATFTKKVPEPKWLGILGPILRARTGEFLRVTFLNRTDRALSMHPHGVRYDKDSEGAYYYPDPGRGGWVSPGQQFTYVWLADAASGPQPGEASSKVWLYHSHVTHDAELPLGLMGAIVITDRARSRADATPRDIDRELVALFYIFDENEDLSPEVDADDETPERRRRREAFQRLSPEEQQRILEGGEKHAINGRIFGNLEGFEMVEGERVRWYLLGLGSEKDLHTAHWHGATLREGGKSLDVVPLLPAMGEVADVIAASPGTWLFHCHVSDHMMGGMFTNYVVHPKGWRQPEGALATTDEIQTAKGERHAH